MKPLGWQISSGTMVSFLQARRGRAGAYPARRGGRATSRAGRDVVVPPKRAGGAKTIRQLQITARAEPVARHCPRGSRRLPEPGGTSLLRDPPTPAGNSFSPVGGGDREGTPRGSSDPDPSMSAEAPGFVFSAFFIHPVICPPAGNWGGSSSSQV